MTAEHRLRVKPLTADRPRNVADKNQYAAMYRFRTGMHRSPKRCRACGSVFADHACGGPR